MRTVIVNNILNIFDWETESQSTVLSNLSQTILKAYAGVLSILLIPTIHSDFTWIWMLIVFYIYIIWPLLKYLYEGDKEDYNLKTTFKKSWLWLFKVIKTNISYIFFFIEYQIECSGYIALFKFITLTGTIAIAGLYGLFPQTAVYTVDLCEIWASRIFGENLFPINPNNSLFQITKVEMDKLSKFHVLKRTGVCADKSGITAESDWKGIGWTVLKGVAWLTIVVAAAAFSARVSD